MQVWLVWVVTALAAVLALLAVALGVALARARSATALAVAQAREESAAVRAQLDALERRLESPTVRTPRDAEFVITDLGRDAEDEAEPAPAVDGTLFADLVLRETAVKAAALVHGVRRALDPETRNRIRFEMRREVKRARKQRRADLREAKREWAARRRAELGEEGSAA